MSTSYFDPHFGNVERAVINKIRTTLGVSGLLTLFIGILILAWPVKSAAVVAGIVAIYAVIAGLINLAIALFSRRVGTWPRVGYAVLGAAFILSGIVMFLNLKTAAASLAILVGILVGVVWIVEGIVGLTMVRDAASKVWAIIFAIVSVIAGVTLISSPLWGAALLWLFLGVSLVVLGIVQIIRAFRFGA